jgi:hypothetical protein
MDDEHLFGQVLHRLNFSVAIARDLLTDYKVIIVGVDDPMIKAWIDQRELLKTDTNITADAQTFAAYVGLMKVMRDYDLKRVISFHGRVQRAQDFANQYLKVLDWATPEHKPAGVIKADYVSGNMNAGDRSRKINQLKTLYRADRGLLANARCLSEGVDVPALDGVAFIDPRKSQVDIVQAVGRAIRKSDNKTHGIIIIPVFIGDSDNPEAELENSRYKPIWDVLNALRSHDDVLAEELDNFRTSLGRNKGGSGGGFTKITIDLPRTVDNKFVAALNARIVEITTVSWYFWYGLLLDYVEEFGNVRVPLRLKYNDYLLGSWVSHQRRGKNKLSLERIKLLEELPQWSWDVFEDNWNKSFEYLKKYVEEYGHARVHFQFKYEGFNLGSWVSNQRKRDNIDLEKVKMLEALPKWSWNTLDDKWNEGVEHLTKYVEEFGHAQVPQGLKYDDFNLGLWVSNKRVNKNKLDLEKIQFLQELPEWSWDVLEDKWNEGFKYLKEYVEEQGHAKVPLRFKYKNYLLGYWVSDQRRNKDKLNLEKTKKLESLPQWSWDVLEDKWNEGFFYLKKYIEEYGHSKVPVQLRYNSYLLGSWVSDQRQRKMQNKLSPERIQHLDSLPQWSWDVLEDKWSEGFSYLKKYIEEHSHAKVPFRLKYEKFNLGQWVSTQKKEQNKLCLKRIQLLEELPQWSWKVIETQWHEAFNYLKKYVEEYGHARVPLTLKYKDFKLGAWVSNQRRGKDKLNLERVKLLETLPQWSWSIYEDEWNESFNFLKKYVEEYGHARVSQGFKYGDFNLGIWVINQRQGRNKLDLERIKKLESLHGWAWSVKSE